MRVTFFGTRGSVPVAHPKQQAFGGNTTCLRIESSCLPAGNWLVVDSGSGIVPLSGNFMKDRGLTLTLLQTHWHHDHTQGMPLSAFPYVKHIPVDIYGPKEAGIGGRKVFEDIMRKPVFPVDFAEVGSHIRFHDIDHPNSEILVIHPEGGSKRLKLEEFEVLEKSGKQFPFNNRLKFALGECLVIKMHRSNHPEQTIIYRFEERTTGQVFVFVTDHENTDGVPLGLRRHLTGATLLVMDSQYTRERYMHPTNPTSGYGHATPDYVAMVAREVGAPALGLTHHDPTSMDTDVAKIVATAKDEAGLGIIVFGCRDYMAIDVGDVGKSLANTR